jgi:hypothetical protein
MVSGGDWYQPPYSAWVAGSGSDRLSLAAGWNGTMVPGAIWPVGGADAPVAYSATDFNTGDCVHAVYELAAERATWSRREGGPSTHTQEQGPVTAVAASGRVVASACTHGDGKGISSLPSATLIVSDLSGGGGSTRLRERWVNSSMETVRLSDDGAVLIAFTSTVPINRSRYGLTGPSIGRVWSIPPIAPDLDVAPTTPRLISTVAYGGHVQATCLSPSGIHLVVTTTFQTHRILFYRVHRGVGLVELANSSYPSFDGANYTYTYAATCRVNDRGEAAVSFPLFRGPTTVTQTALAGFNLPTTAVAGDCAPAWTWISTAVDPSLQDIPSSDSMSRDGSFYAYASSGGLGSATRAPPPTLRVFRIGKTAAGAHAPIAEIVTPSPFRARTTNATLSASLVAVDIHLLGPTEEGPSECDPAPARGGGAERLLVLGVGLDAHMNTGSEGGMRHLWCVRADPSGSFSPPVVQGLV